MMLPMDENIYKDLTDEQRLKWFFSATAQFMTPIIGYCELLKREAQRPEIQLCIPTEFVEYYDGILKAAHRLMEERDVIIRSMESPPPDAKVS